MGNRAGSQRLIQLGERIRQKRKDSHLSQETFAEKAGISVNTKEQKIVLKTKKALMDGMEGKDGWKVPQI